ncbi:MAG: DUF2853 domain-containing protein [Alphaproteobacteria bacterium HGW-Alphaproteobacteria-18]|nr:MAG: DUF2853 domain-containing protein [Alphaproteobacteria bacterium HGW-Alphaproteobacteria-18]
MAKATTKAPSAKEVLVEKYIADLKEKVGETRPDLALLDACVKACGPAIYKSDAATVAASDKEELARVKMNFIGKRLGVTDEAKADAAIKAAIEKYGRSVRAKHRPVVYYLIAKELKKAAALKNA